MVNFIDCGRQEFISRTKGKRVYCFGKGRYLNDFTGEKYGIKIEGIIDNYRYLDLKPVIMEDYVVEILSIEKFKKICDCNCAVVITCFSFEDVLSQLDSIEEFCGMDCYIEPFIRHYTEHSQISFIHNYKEQLIPKKIHYCWFGGKEIPEEYKKNIESWGKFCPDYEIIRWDETNYDVHKNTYIGQAYDNKKWAFVSDYARTDILYHEGGIYFDTDIEVIKSFDEFLVWRMFCGFEDLGIIAWGLGFGTVKKEPILKDVLDIYENMVFVLDDGRFNMVTCPIIQTDVMKKYGFEPNGLFQERDRVAVYPKEFFAPISYIRGFGRITDNTHSIHQYAASWTNAGQVRTRLEMEKKIAQVRARSKHSIINQKHGKKAEAYRFQLWECINDFETAGGKAPNDIKDIAVDMGYHILDIHPREGLVGSERWKWSSNRLADDWKRFFHIIPEQAIIFLQYPFNQIQQERHEVLMRLKAEKNVRLVLFIHDVEALRYNNAENWDKSDLSDVLRLTDVLIVHNERMKRFFIGKGFCEKRIVCLGVFDYLCEKKQQVILFEKSIVIAGNLEKRKSAYIEKLFELSPLKIYLYGHNYMEEPGKDNNIIYHGAFSSRELPQILEGGFGLVWDGDQLETCSGVTGEYLKYNNPHKLSLYLAAGIPVIIWKEAAEASFVEENGLGVTVSSLFEVNDILNEVKEETYNMYLQNVQVVSEKIVKGYYTKRAIEEAENILLIKE